VNNNYFKNYRKNLVDLRNDQGIIQMFFGIQKLQQCNYKIMKAMATFSQAG
jgi:hypothetical protein